MRFRLPLQGAFRVTAAFAIGAAGLIGCSGPAPGTVPVDSSIWQRPLHDPSAEDASDAEVEKADEKEESSQIVPQKIPGRMAAARTSRVKR